MNTGILILIITIVILTIVIISILIFTAVSNDSDPGTILLPCTKTVNISTLIQIPADYPSCVQEGQNTSKYYVGKLNPDFDYVVAPFNTPVQDVCRQYCTNYSNGVCSGNETAQQNYDNCIKQLTPTDCYPPLPIAAIGAKLYYPFSPTCNTCENCSSLPK
jgi:hypothetical protein